MSAAKSHFFALTNTFLDRDCEKVISELQAAGATGVNLALNYHASRDFLLRQGPNLAYLADGFHYYAPDFSRYPTTGLRPSGAEHWTNNDLLENVLDSAQAANFDVTAWAVFLHNGAIGRANPDSTVTNALGNHFLSELCPSNLGVQGYVQGLVADLASRDISAIAIESLHFHGARHGEHHERFFLEMSTTTEFLLSLCFCPSCISAFEGEGGDAQALKDRVGRALQPFLDDGDPWLNKKINKDLLGEIAGDDILFYLRTRERTVTSLYARAYEIAQSAGITLRLVDQSPVLDYSDNLPLESSWLLGIDYLEVQNYVDVYEPLIYRNQISDVAELTAHYREQIQKEIIPIIRPTFPDNSSAQELREKVSRIRALGVSEIDFYLLDTMRPRDLDWISRALA